MNASHALSVSYDALYGAYLKAYYPLEFYKAMLDIFTEKKDKDKISKIKQEMKNGFNITFGEYKFGKDNTHHAIDKKENMINNVITSIKSLSKKLANDLYELSNTKNYDKFIDLLIDLIDSCKVKKNQLDILVKLDYFSDFAKAKKLIKAIEYYTLLKPTGKLKVLKKAKLPELLEDYPLLTKVKPHCTETDKQFKLENWILPLYEIFEELENEDFTTNFKIKHQMEYLGYVSDNYDLPDDIMILSGYERKYKNPILTFKSANSNKIFSIKCRAKVYDANPLELGDIVRIVDFKDEKRWVKTDNGFENIDETEKILKKYEKVNVKDVKILK